MVKTSNGPARGDPMPRTEDLATEARRSGYRVGIVADQLGYSARWLELFCRKHFALTPHAWLIRLRDQEVQKLAQSGAPAKAICQLVGFADAASLCHSLKRHVGCTLKELRGNGRNGCSQKDNKDCLPQVTGTRQTTKCSILRTA